MTNSPYDFSPKEYDSSPEDSTNENTNSGSYLPPDYSSYAGAKAAGIGPVSPAPQYVQEQVSSSQPYGSTPHSPYSSPAAQQPQPGQEGQQWQGSHPPQQGYYHPQYPAYPYPAPTPPQGMAITSVVLGAVALVFSWIPFFNFFTGLAAIAGSVLGGIGISKANKGEAGGKPMAIVGTSMSVVAFLIGALINIAIFASL